MSSVQQQHQLLADTRATQASSTTSSSSVLGNGHVEENRKTEKTEDVVEGRSGLVSLRRGEEVVKEKREQQRLGVRRAVQQTEDVKEEGGTQVAPEPNSLDARVVADWTMPVEWTGTVRERNVAGADVGNRLYAGKKRMFKGHKWERMRERRVGRTKMLLRDMDERIQRFKGVRIFFVFGTAPLFPPPPSPFPLPPPLFSSLPSSFLLTAFLFAPLFSFQYRAKGKPLPLARRRNVLKKTQKLPF